MNDLDYNLLKSKKEDWYCVLCASEIPLFCQINEKMTIPKGNLNKPTGALLVNPLVRIAVVNNRTRNSTTYYS